MYIAGQETHLFNPMILKTASSDDMLKEINVLANKWNPNANMPYEIASNIDVASDLLMIYGEFISKLTEQEAKIKLNADCKEAKQVYVERKNWKDVSEEKAPAMSYFEALAKEQVKDERTKQYELHSDLTRFKYAYDSLESKMNAQKKKLEAMKYEEL